MDVFNKIEEEKSMCATGSEQHNIGFPGLMSSIQSEETAEILMEALGPHLRKILKECPGGVFSKPTVYMITIQLVSKC